MNWHATLIALMICVGIATVLSLGEATYRPTVEEHARIVYLYTIPLALAFCLLVGVVNA